MNKHITYAIFAGLICLLLVACGGGNDDPATPSLQQASPGAALALDVGGAYPTGTVLAQPVVSVAWTNMTGAPVAVQCDASATRADNLVGAQIAGATFLSGIQLRGTVDGAQFFESSRNTDGAFAGSAKATVPAGSTIVCDLRLRIEVLIGTLTQTQGQVYKLTAKDAAISVL